jgi:cold shock CspA family protein
VKGKMLWFNESKRYGFIESETGARVYVHQSAFLRGDVPVGRCKGLEVEFSLRQEVGGDVAAEVSRSPQVDQRRTTRHHNAHVAR